MPKINPFIPNSPVTHGMFVGRIREVEALEQAFIQTRAGRPKNFMITGERGIGKTSLLMYLAALARGVIALNGDRFNFLTIETDLDSTTTQFGLVKKIELGLRRELAKTEKARTFLQDAWAFVQRVEAAGISLKDGNREQNETMLEEFAYSLADTARRVCSATTDDVFNASYDGVLIVIDEADNASPDLDLGSFLKLLLERVQRHSCDRVMIGLAGLPDLRDRLRESHESALRLFDEIVLDRLSHEHVGMVLHLGLKHANEQNQERTAITESAKDLLVNFSEGYPHFIQQFGYCAFAADTDGTIDDDDVTEGALGTRGALELIGDRYYRNAFYNHIQKDSYRQVLRIMAGKLDGWISKDEIRQGFRGQESTLSSALKALRARHIILSKEGERGVYRLQHRAFALWIRVYARISGAEPTATANVG